MKFAIENPDGSLTDKIAVFDTLKRSGKVCTKVFNTKAKTLMLLIASKVASTLFIQTVIAVTSDLNVSNFYCDLVRLIYPVLLV